MKQARTPKVQRERMEELLTRMEQFGPDTLGNPELLELFGAGPGAPTVFELTRLAPHQLAQRVGPEVAATLRAAIELGRRALQANDVRPRLRTTKDVYLYLEPVLGARDRERFHVLCLNSRSVLIADVLVAEGTPYQCMVDPREVFRAALRAPTHSIILAHNHPSGDPTPSEPDLALTRQLVTAGRALNIPVVDHLVVGAGRFVSVAERGLCDFGGPLAPMSTGDSGR
jgi:DNA repair protein RadC